MNKFLSNSNTFYFVSTDLNGNFTFVNDYFSKKYSFINSDFIGTNSLTTIAKEDWQIFIDVVEKCLKDPNSSFNVELRKPNKDNLYTWTHWEFKAKQNNLNQIIGIDCLGYDITDKKHYKNQVNELIQKSELILEKSLTGYWDLNVKNRSAITSETFQKMIGYTTEEFKFSLDSWMGLVVEEDLPIVLKALKEHYETKGKEPLNIEIRYKHKNGNHVWVICTGSVIEWDENNHPVRLVGVHIDITKRKLAEELLIRKDNLLNSFINSTPDLFFLKDENLKYIIANKALQELYQLSENEIIGKTDFDILPFEIAEICKVGDEKPLKDGGTVVREERNVLGKIVQTYKFPVVLENGSLGVGTYARDITELKKSEIEKINNYNFLRSVLNSSHEVVYIINRDYNIIEANSRAIKANRELFKVDSIINRSIFDFLPSDLRKNFKQYYDLAFDGYKHSKEVKIDWGTAFNYYEIDFYPIYNNDDNIDNIVISAKINSENILLREKLKQEVHEKELIANSFLLFEENERRKQAAELHDGIGQLLFATCLHLQNVKHSDDEELRKGVTLLKEAKAELNNITNNQTVFWSKETTLEQAIKNYFKRIEGANNIVINNEILKQYDEISISENNKLNYFRVLQAATQNSIKHSSASTITIRIVENKNFLTTMITDNGSGFDKRNIEKGMGLTNIENRVKIMNGRFKIFTKLNKGTIVAFQIPMNNENN
ncbi:MAG: PAS domain S-box protein [Bacteroidetes bacterium]|nr:PAS domain S-box protein [Bacteroidota bacterium]